MQFFYFRLKIFFCMVNVPLYIKFCSAKFFNSIFKVMTLLPWISAPPSVASTSVIASHFPYRLQTISDIDQNHPLLRLSTINRLHLKIFSTVDIYFVHLIFKCSICMCMISRHSKILSYQNDRLRSHIYPQRICRSCN